MKSSVRLSLAALLAVLAALALGACGGGGGGDEDEITDVVTEVATEKSTEQCTEVLTLNFNEQSQKTSGEEAVGECEEDAEEGDEDADSVEVSEVQVDGESAEADVAFTGGSFDGQTLTVGLVEEDDQWKLDEVLAFADFDREAMLAAFREGLEEQAEEQGEAELFECVADGLDEFEDEELQDLILARSDDSIVELVEACQ